MVAAGTSVSSYSFTIKIGEIYRIDWCEQEEQLRNIIPYNLLLLYMIFNPINLLPKYYEKLLKISDFRGQPFIQFTTGS